MNASASIIALDAKGIMRDGVMLINVGLSAVIIAIITVLGYYQHDNAGMGMSFISPSALYSR